MRQDCKFFESRTYANGDTVRKCDLDLAPEAPWRCPDDCPAYTRRMADVNWAHGTLVTPETPPEPKGLGEDDSIAALLDAAEDIINDAVPSTIADLEEERRKRDKKGLRLPGRGGKSKPGKDNPATSKSGKAKPGKLKKPGKQKPPKNNGESLGERMRRRYREGQ